MISADFELQKLRSYLQTKGLDNSYIDEVCQSASMEIGQAISDALAVSMEEAVQAGANQDAGKFIEELRAVTLNNDYYISTDTGDMDFSEPPFPMMANLLKNPKVAKDGSLYKVIPMGSGSGSRNPIDLASAQTAINNARNAAQNSGGTSHTGPAVFSGTFAAQKATIRNNEVSKKIATKNSSGINFKTVSSKQDPSKQWIRPATDKDMTTAVTQINMSLRQSIDDTIVSVIQRYMEMT